MILLENYILRNNSLLFGPFKTILTEKIMWGFGMTTFLPVRE